MILSHQIFANSILSKRCSCKHLFILNLRQGKGIKYQFFLIKSIIASQKKFTWAFFKHWGQTMAVNEVIFKNIIGLKHKIFILLVFIYKYFIREILPINYPRFGIWDASRLISWIFCPRWTGWSCQMPTLAGRRGSCGQSSSPRPGWSCPRSSSTRRDLHRHATDCALPSGTCPCHSTSWRWWSSQSEARQLSHPTGHCRSSP